MAEVVIDTDKSVKSIETLNKEIEDLTESNKDLAESEEALAKSIRDTGSATSDQVKDLKSLQAQQSKNTKTIKESEGKVKIYTKTMDDNSRAVQANDQSARNLARTFGGPLGAALADTSEGMEELTSLSKGITFSFSSLNAAVILAGLGLVAFIAAGVVQYLEDMNEVSNRVLLTFNNINDSIILGQRLIDSSTDASIKASRIQLNIDRQRRKLQGDISDDRRLEILANIIKLEKEKAQVITQAAANEQSAAKNEVTKLTKQRNDLQDEIKRTEDEVVNILDKQRKITKLVDLNVKLVESQEELDKAITASTISSVAFTSTLSSGEQGIINAETAYKSFSDSLITETARTSGVITNSQQAEIEGFVGNEVEKRTQIRQTATLRAEKTAEQLLADQNAHNVRVANAHAIASVLVNGILGLAQLSDENAKRQQELALFQVLLNGAIGISNAATIQPLNPVTLAAAIASALINTAVAVKNVKAVSAPAPLGSPGFQVGGYTGYGLPNEEAGIVHKGEYVVPSNVLGTSIGSSLVSGLEGLRTGQSTPSQESVADQVVAGLRRSPIFVKVKDIVDESNIYVTVIDDASY